MSMGRTSVKLVDVGAAEWVVEIDIADNAWVLDSTQPHAADGGAPDRRR